MAINVKLLGILCLVSIVAYGFYQIVSAIRWHKETEKETNKAIKDLLEFQLKCTLEQEDSK